MNAAPQQPMMAPEMQMMPMPMPMMGMPMPMMMPMPMQGSMGMGGMMPMGMPHPMMMGGMPMPMPMMPPMMGMRPMMMARMTCEMTKDGMVCTMAPMDAAQMEMMKACCDMMNGMMAMGMPAMMACGGMPLVMCSR